MARRMLRPCRAHGMSRSMSGSGTPPATSSCSGSRHMANLVITFWRDIPAQVTAARPGGRRSERVKRELAPRFAQAIDMAAMRAGVTGSDAYLADWRQGEPVACGEDLEAAVIAEVTRLEAECDDERLRALIAAGGRGEG